MADSSPSPIYLRVGEFPEGERSRVGAYPNYLSGMGRKTDDEAGVSVYRVERCPERNLWKVVDCGNYASVMQLVALLYAREREAWIVTGTPVRHEHLTRAERKLHECAPDGFVYGIDGETLLRGLEKVSEVTPWEFYVPGCHSPWEDPEEYDTPQPAM